MTSLKEMLSLTFLKAMNNKIYILGAGGHTRSIVSLLEHNNYNISGVFDNSYNNKKTENISGFPLIGKFEDIPDNVNLILSIGDNGKRKQLLYKYQKQIVKENLIHPEAFIEKSVVIGKSNQLFSNVYVNSNAKIGDNNIINTGCILEHEVLIGSHNHISVGAILCGRVTIGDCCFVGAGAVIIDKITICSDVVIGANSVIIDNIIEPGTYAGNPARRV